MTYSQYLQSAHWQETRKIKLADSDHCQICDKQNNLHIHHKRYTIGEKEARLSTKRGLNVKEGSVLGREKTCDLIVLCSSCHRLWHSYFGDRYLTHKKASQIRRLLKFRVIKDKAFMITKNFVLYTPILKEARRKLESQDNAIRD
jgi:hypothetical protein